MQFKFRNKSNYKNNMSKIFIDSYITFDTLDTMQAYFII